jgi:glycosyltransferase involved in cell wall biosynthesis
MQINDLQPLGQPLVSILINNYNYGHFLADAIDSALAQTYPHVEVIVVDDGSTDHSRAVIANYGDKIISVLKANGGQASAFNAGFAAAQGEIICFLDADDICLPTKVAEVVNAIPDPQASQWCFHILQFGDAQLEPIQSHFDQQETGLLHRFDLRTQMRRGGIRGQLPFSLPPTTGLCFTRPLLQQIMPMPEAGGIAINDTYLQFIALSLAAGVGLARKLAVQRVHQHNTLTNTPLAKRALAVSRVNCFTSYWIHKNYPFLGEFTDKLFAAGLSAHWRSRSVEVAAVIDQYLGWRPMAQKISIYTRASYHTLFNYYLR